MTDTNQASEDELIKSKTDWSTPYDEWLKPIINRFRHGGAIECRAIPSEIQLNIESVIRTEKLKLLDRLSSHQEDLFWWTGGEYEKTKAIDMRAVAAERELLTKLEAEL